MSFKIFKRLINGERERLRQKSSNLHYPYFNFDSLHWRLLEEQVI
jgi:hypothetical protein